MRLFSNRRQQAAAPVGLGLGVKGYEEYDQNDAEVTPANGRHTRPSVSSSSSRSTGSRSHEQVHRNQQQHLEVPRYPVHIASNSNSASSPSMTSKSRSPSSTRSYSPYSLNSASSPLTSPASPSEPSSRQFPVHVPPHSKANGIATGLALAAAAGAAPSSSMSASSPSRRDDRNVASPIQKALSPWLGILTENEVQAAPPCKDLLRPSGSSSKRGKKSSKKAKQKKKQPHKLHLTKGTLINDASAVRYGHARRQSRGRIVGNAAGRHDEAASSSSDSGDSSDESEQAIPLHWHLGKHKLERLSLHISDASNDTGARHPDSSQRVPPLPASAAIQAPAHASTSVVSTQGRVPARSDLLDARSASIVNDPQTHQCTCNHARPQPTSDFARFSIAGMLSLVDSKVQAEEAQREAQERLESMRNAIDYDAFKSAKVTAFASDFTSKTLPVSAEHAQAERRQRAPPCEPTAGDATEVLENAGARLPEARPSGDDKGAVAASGSDTTLGSVISLRDEVVDLLNYAKRSSDSSRPILIDKSDAKSATPAGKHSEASCSPPGKHTGVLHTAGRPSPMNPADWDNSPYGRPQLQMKDKPAVKAIDLPQASSFGKNGMAHVDFPSGQPVRKGTPTSKLGKFLFKKTAAKKTGQDSGRPDVSSDAHTRDSTESSARSSSDAGQGSTFKRIEVEEGEGNSSFRVLRKGSEGTELKRPSVESKVLSATSGSNRPAVDSASKSPRTPQMASFSAFPAAGPPGSSLETPRDQTARNSFGSSTPNRSPMATPKAEITTPKGRIGPPLAAATLSSQSPESRAGIGTALHGKGTTMPGVKPPSAYFRYYTDAKTSKGESGGDPESLSALLASRSGNKHGRKRSMSTPAALIPDLPRATGPSRASDDGLKLSVDRPIREDTERPNGDGQLRPTGLAGLTVESSAFLQPPTGRPQRISTRSASTHTSTANVSSRADSVPAPSPTASLYSTDTAASLTPTRVTFPSRGSSRQGDGSKQLTSASAAVNAQAVDQSSASTSERVHRARGEVVKAGALVSSASDVTLASEDDASEAGVVQLADVRIRRPPRTTHAAIHAGPPKSAFQKAATQESTVQTGCRAETAPRRDLRPARQRTASDESAVDPVLVPSPAPSESFSREKPKGAEGKSATRTPTLANVRSAPNSSTSTSSSSSSIAAIGPPPASPLPPPPSAGMANVQSQSPRSAPSRHAHRSAPQNELGKSKSETGGTVTNSSKPSHANPISRDPSEPSLLPYRNTSDASLSSITRSDPRISPSHPFPPRPSNQRVGGAAKSKASRLPSVDETDVYSGIAEDADGDQVGSRTSRPVYTREDSTSSSRPSLSMSTGSSATSSSDDDELLTSESGPTSDYAFKEGLAARSLATPFESSSYHAKNDSYSHTAIGGIMTSPAPGWSATGERGHLEVGSRLTSGTKKMENVSQRAQRANEAPLAARPRQTLRKLDTQDRLTQIYSDIVGELALED